MHIKKPLSLLLLVSSVLLLSNCDLFKDTAKEVEKKQSAIGSGGAHHAAPAKKHDDGSKVLLKIDGEPSITEKEFEAYKKQFAEAQPQYAAFFEDPNFEEQLFQGFVNERLLDKWVKDTKVDLKPEYQKELNDIMDFGRRTLNVKHFQDAHPVDVSDKDAKKFYEENKNSPQFMMEAGGVTALEVTFDTKEKAEAFFDKVKSNPVAFAQSAKEDNLKVKDLGDVHQQSFNVEGPLREKILAIKSFPHVDMVKVSDDSYAVVYASGKKEAKHVDYDQVKEPIKNMLKQQKSAENMMDKLKGLESKYTVDKTNHFEHKKAEKDAAQQKAMHDAKSKKHAAAEASESVAPKTAPQAA